MKDIQPIIMDADFNKIAVIDDYKSLIWTTRYWDCGDFEIVVTTKYIPLIQYRYYIYREDDPRTGIVEYIELTYNEDGEELMLIKGRFLESILSRRVIPSIASMTGTPGRIINDLVNDNLTVPGTGDVYRGIANFQISPDPTGGNSISRQFELGENILEVVAALAQEYEIGFKVILTPTGSSPTYVFQFQTFSGVDRSYNQNSNPYVVYSVEYENLLSSDYIEDYQSISTAVLVGGEGDGEDRVKVWSDIDVEAQRSPLYRYESFVDSQNTSSELVEYSRYTAMLKAEANQYKTQYAQSFGGTVDFESYKWNEDVFIGDVVEIRNENWGVSIHGRIIEVIESISEDGTYSLTPTFQF